jgi:hypothetical protein
MFSSAVLLSCVSSKKVLLSSGQEYWSEFHTGDTTTLQTEYEVYLQEADSMLHFTNYYHFRFILFLKFVMLFE